LKAALLILKEPAQSLGGAREAIDQLIVIAEEIDALDLWTPRAEHGHATQARRSEDG
jgi:hypothetical protein